jgi:hypothetical protein
MLGVQGVDCTKEKSREAVAKNENHRGELLNATDISNMTESVAVAAYAEPGKKTMEKLQEPVKADPEMNDRWGSNRSRRKPGNECASRRIQQQQIISARFFYLPAEYPVYSAGVLCFSTRPCSRA